MTFSDISTLLSNHFTTGADLPGAISVNTANFQPYLLVPADRLTVLCQFLRDDERLFFDLLACITAIDNGAEINTIDVLYNLTSIPYEHNLMLKVVVPRQTNQPDLPVVPSVAHIWRTADWHEREAFDLVGIRFGGHPDLRRILLPTDWIGHPLRTDYREDEQYHGIQTK